MIVWKTCFVLMVLISLVGLVYFANNIINIVIQDNKKKNNGTEESDESSD